MKYFTLNSPEDWELYCAKPGVEEAASALTARLLTETRVVCILMGNNMRYTANRASDEVYRRMRDHMTQHSAFGALDTEPMGILRDWLEIKFGVRPEW